jgi:hypothetical protein
MVIRISPRKHIDETRERLDSIRREHYRVRTH